MSSGRIAEMDVEQAALAWLESSGFAVGHGPEIAVGQPAAERSDAAYRDVLLERRLREALVRLNPELPQEALDDAFRKIVRADGQSLIERNRAVHRMLVDGVTVEYRRADGSITGAQARVIDFNDPDNNDWLAVNQFTVVGPQRHNRRADIVIFLNGLPLGVIELKNPADEKATIGSALNQLQTYGAQIPALFDYNCALVVSDGTEARIGVLGATLVLRACSEGSN
jgi:type I restriction enzyme R subunit